MSFKDKYDQFKHMFRNEPGRGQRILDKVRNGAASAVDSIADAASDAWDWGEGKWNDAVNYWEQAPEVWQEFQQHPDEVKAAVVKGLSNKAVDSVSGLYGTFVEAPAAIGGYLGSKIYDMAYPDLNKAPARVRERIQAYKDAIPAAQQQMHLPMRPLEIANNNVQNSEGLRTNDISGKTEEWARRFGAGIGTQAETALWGTALGGKSFWNAIGNAPVKGWLGAWGGDMLGNTLFMNDRERASAAGAESTYDRQANERAAKQREKATQYAKDDYHAAVADAARTNAYSPMNQIFKDPVYWGSETYKPYMQALENIDQQLPAYRDAYEQYLYGDVE